MKNTPRTDAATVRMERLDGDIDEVVSADFARTLERELIATRSATEAPVAWLIKYDAAPNTGQMQQITHGHNAIGDYRQIDPAATSTPLYSSPQSLPVEKEAIGHARYEYVRTLNPRRFAALYNESLMGVHQFDDLVDRYRMKGEKP